MRTNLFVASQLVIADYQSKRISLINILEDITVDAFPFAVPASVFTFLTRTLDEGNDPNIRIKALLNDEVLLEIAIDTHFEGNHTYLKNLAAIGALVITETGVLSFKLFHNENQISEYSINIKQRVQPVALPAEQ